MSWQPPSGEPDDPGGRQWQPPGGGEWKPAGGGDWQPPVAPAGPERPAGADEQRPQAWPPQPPDAPLQWQPPPPSSGKATAALIMGILGLIVCPLVCSVAALVLGYSARGEIDRSGGTLGGRGSAVAGIVLGWIGVALVAVFAILFAIGLAVGSTSSITSS